jgi:hypothetical protein
MFTAEAETGSSKSVRGRAYLGKQKRTVPKRAGLGNLQTDFERLTISATATSSLEPSSKLFSTQNIYFSQASVSEMFTDGTLVSELSRQLISGERRVSEIPAIRIVDFQKKWITLDNRRLRAFKDAMIDQIPAIVCDLKTPEVARDFHAKRTNKSSESGGIVRTFSTASTQHFDDGAFVFVKRILNLTFEQLAEPLVSLKRVSALPTIFYEANQYYNSFLELILEEARASLQAGIESNNTDENKIFELRLQDYKPPKKPENPSPMIFIKKAEEKRLIKAYDAFLLQTVEEPSVKLLALASYAPSEESNRIHLKVVVEQDIYARAYGFFQADVQWTAKPIGSLVTHLRMYDVCTACPTVSWLNQVLTGSLNNTVPLAAPLLAASSTSSHLNASQQVAVDQFLALSEGMQLVQGPPGTGKTTMVVSMLALLAEQGRTLVCAPSNKAVQVLAERFVKKHPHIPAILAGVEDKLPEDNLYLRRIFVHTWGEQKLDSINDIKKKLWTLLPNHIFVGTREKITHQIVGAISEAKVIEDALLTLLADFAKYTIDIAITVEPFKRGIASYVAAMTTSGVPLSLKKQAIVKEDFLDPDKWDHSWNLFFNAIRGPLSEMTGLLTQIDNALRRKMADDSINGLEGQLLNKSTVIFATLSVSGRKLLKEMQRVHALVVDEAGQALEAETLIPLVTRPNKCLLIGDTKQLPATVISLEAARLKFDRSLMSRLLDDCQQKYSLLTTQYRMHPDIRHFPSQQYYEGKLQDSHEIISGRVFIQQLVPRFIAPYSFINVVSQETSSGYSFTNRAEADAIAVMMQYLQDQLHLNVIKQLGVITFYKAQARMIQDKVQKIFPGVKVNTVDSFQGDENDLIIISCVRSNASGNIGFVNDFRRLNVALTRAKHGLMVLGNAATLQSREGDLGLLVRDAAARKCFFEYEAIRQSLLPKPKLSAMKAKSAKQPALLALAANNGASSSTPPEKALPNKAVCKFDQKKPGSCRHGANCQFSHVAFLSASAAVGSSQDRVPIAKKRALVKK